MNLTTVPFSLVSSEEIQFSSKHLKDTNYIQVLEPDTAEQRLQSQKGRQVRKVVVNQGPYWKMSANISGCHNLEVEVVSESSRWRSEMLQHT